MAPITADMVIAGKGNRANKGSSLFPAEQVGSVADSPQFSGGHGPESSAVSTDPGSTAAVPTFTAPTGPLDGSPASFTVLDVAADAPVGEVTSGNAPASGDANH